MIDSIVGRKWGSFNGDYVAKIVDRGHRIGLRLDPGAVRQLMKLPLRLFLVGIELMSYLMDLEASSIRCFPQSDLFGCAVKSISDVGLSVSETLNGIGVWYQKAKEYVRTRSSIG